MKDLISRQAAIDALANELYHNEEDYRTAVKAIGGLSSAEPKTAVWVGEGDGYVDGEIILDTWYCSNCNYLYDYDEKPDWNYCPHCGAKMETSE